MKQWSASIFSLFLLRHLLAVIGQLRNKCGSAYVTLYGDYLRNFEVRSLLKPGTINGEHGIEAIDSEIPSQYRTSPLIVVF